MLPTLSPTLIERCIGACPTSLPQEHPKSRKQHSLWEMKLSASFLRLLASEAWGRQSSEVIFFSVPLSFLRAECQAPCRRLSCSGLGLAAGSWANSEIQPSFVVALTPEPGLGLTELWPGQRGVALCLPVGSGNHRSSAFSPSCHF